MEVEIAPVVVAAIGKHSHMVGDLIITITIMDITTTEIDTITTIDQKILIKGVIITQVLKIIKTTTVATDISSRTNTKIEMETITIRTIITTITKTKIIKILTSKITLTSVLPISDL